MSGTPDDRQTPGPNHGPDTPSCAEAWPTHLVRAGSHSWSGPGEPDPGDHREEVEPWLSALFQAEHLNVLVGSGFTTAIAKAAGAPEVDMRPAAFQHTYTEEVMRAAREGAKRLGRDEPNIEDQVRTINELIAGLRILAGATNDHVGDDDEPKPSAAMSLQEWGSALDATLSELLKKLLATERGIAKALSGPQDNVSGDAGRLLGGFLLPFASRTATRERAHIFTTNYDRLIERGCDLLGLRVVDRFVGSLAPVFRSSRLGIDLHYNPPGIRGEPRYLEGVVRFTKLHGSVDWRSFGPPGGLNVQRCGLPFGAADSDPDVPTKTGERLLVYPNAAKDVETLELPYAELFRDLAAAVCQPNAVVVTYGYGFGDDHVNRVLRDMLSIPSTHLVIISYDEAGGRLKAFHDAAGHEAQITLLVGPHFGHLATLVEHYLPKPAIDRTTWRMVDLLHRRARPRGDDEGPKAPGDREREELV